MSGTSCIRMFKSNFQSRCTKDPEVPQQELRGRDKGAMIQVFIKTSFNKTIALEISVMDELSDLFSKLARVERVVDCSMLSIHLLGTSLHKWVERSPDLRILQGCTLQVARLLRGGASDFETSQISTPLPAPSAALPHVDVSQEYKAKIAKVKQELEHGQFDQKYQNFKFDKNEDAKPAIEKLFLKIAKETKKKRDDLLGSVEYKDQQELRKAIDGWWGQDERPREPSFESFFNAVKVVPHAYGQRIQFVQNLRLDSWLASKLPAGELHDQLKGFRSMEEEKLYQACELFFQDVLCLLFKAHRDLNQKAREDERMISAVQLNTKFASDPNAFVGNYAKLNDFYKGPEVRLGHPNPKIYAGMEREHCAVVTRNMPFMAPNYGVCTTSELEWYWVVDSDRNRLAKKASARSLKLLHNNLFPGEHGYRIMESVLQVKVLNLRLQSIGEATLKKSLKEEIECRFLLATSSVPGPPNAPKRNVVRYIKVENNLTLQDTSVEATVVVSLMIRDSDVLDFFQQPFELQLNNAKHLNLISSVSESCLDIQNQSKSPQTYNVELRFSDRAKLAEASGEKAIRTVLEDQIKRRLHAVFPEAYQETVRAANEKQDHDENRLLYVRTVAWPNPQASKRSESSDSFTFELVLAKSFQEDKTAGEEKSLRKKIMQVWNKLYGTGHIGDDSKISVQLKDRHIIEYADLSMPPLPPPPPPPRPPPPSQPPPVPSPPPEPEISSSCCFVSTSSRDTEAKRRQALQQSQIARQQLQLSQQRKIAEQQRQSTAVRQNENAGRQPQEVNHPSTIDEVIQKVKDQEASLEALLKKLSSGSAQKPSQPKKRQGRAPPKADTIDKFRDCLLLELAENKRKDQDAPDPKTVRKLLIEEIIALRLYTGPIYVIYNSILRGQPLEMVADLGACRFVCTIFAIISGITKLARSTKIPENRLMYRGLSGVMLPNQFWQPDEFGFRGGVEFGLMSVTSDLNTALQYSGHDKKRAIVFEIQCSRVDIGASIGFLSQYPGEREFLTQPLSCLEVTGDPVVRFERLKLENNGEKSVEVLVFPMRVNVNLKCPLIEEIQLRRKTFHLNIAHNLRDDLERTFREIVDEYEVWQEGVSRGRFELIKGNRDQVKSSGNDQDRLSLTCDGSGWKTLGAPWIKINNTDPLDDQLETTELPVAQKVYFEIKITSAVEAIVCAGFAADKISCASHRDNQNNKKLFLGSDEFSWAVASDDGKRGHGGLWQPYMEKLEAGPDGDIIGLAYDVTAGKLDIYRNGELQGGPIFDNIKVTAEMGGSTFPAISCSGKCTVEYNIVGSDSESMNSNASDTQIDDDDAKSKQGKRNFYYQPPGGYVPVARASKVLKHLINKGSVSEILHELNMSESTLLKEFDDLIAQHRTHAQEDFEDEAMCKLYLEEVLDLKLQLINKLKFFLILGWRENAPWNVLESIAKLKPSEFQEFYDNARLFEECNWTWSMLIERRFLQRCIKFPLGLPPNMAKMVWETLLHKSPQSKGIRGAEKCLLDEHCVLLGDQNFGYNPKDKIFTMKNMKTSPKHESAIVGFIMAASTDLIKLDLRVDGDGHEFSSQGMKIISEVVGKEACKLTEYNGFILPSKDSGADKAKDIVREGLVAGYERSVLEFQSLVYEKKKRANFGEMREVQNETNTSITALFHLKKKLGDSDKSTVVSKSSVKIEEDEKFLTHDDMRELNRGQWAFIMARLGLEISESKIESLDLSGLIPLQFLAKDIETQIEQGIRGLSNLKALSIRSDLHEHHHLRHFGLKFVDGSGPGVDSWAKLLIESRALKMPQLTKLDMRNCAVLDDQAIATALGRQLAGLTSLTSLNLSATKLGCGEDFEACVAAIAGGLSVLTKLRIVDLSNNKLGRSDGSGDPLAVVLAEALQKRDSKSHEKVAASSLRKVVFSGNGIRDSDEAKVREKLPRQILAEVEADF